MSTTTSTILLAEEHDATRAFLADNLTADGYRVLIAPDRREGARAAEHGASGPDPRRRQRRDARALDAVRSGEGLAGRADPGHAADRAEPRRRPAAADPDARARRRRRRAQAVRLPGAAGPDRARCCGARELRAERADPARGADRDRRPLARGARVRPAGRAVGQGVRPAGRRSPASRRRVFTREELLRGVWGLQTFGRTRTLDSHASRLRRKLCGDGRRQAGDQRVGRRLPADRRELHRTHRRRGPMSDADRTPPSVVALYQQLAAERAGRARAALARERTRRGAVRARAPPRSRTPPARCCTPRCTFIALDGPLPGAVRRAGRARCSRSRRGSRRPPTSPAPANPTEKRRRNR